VEDAEEGHFDAEEHGRDAPFEIRGLDGLRGFESTSGGEKRYEELDKRNASVGYIPKEGIMG